MFLVDILALHRPDIMAFSKCWAFSTPIKINFNALLVRLFSLHLEKKNIPGCVIWALDLENIRLQIQQWSILY